MKFKPHGAPDGTRAWMAAIALVTAGMRRPPVPKKPKRPAFAIRTPTSTEAMPWYIPPLRYAKRTLKSSQNARAPSDEMVKPALAHGLPLAEALRRGALISGSEVSCLGGID